MARTEIICLKSLVVFPHRWWYRNHPHFSRRADGCLTCAAFDLLKHDAGYARCKSTSGPMPTSPGAMVSGASWRVRRGVPVRIGARSSAIPPQR